MYPMCLWMDEKTWDNLSPFPTNHNSTWSDTFYKFMKAMGIMQKCHKIWFSETNINQYSEAQLTLCHTLLTGHIFQHFHTWHPIHALLRYSVTFMVSRLSQPWRRMLGSQVTNTQNLLTPHSKNHMTATRQPTRFGYPLLPFITSSILIMALYRSYETW
jgi:hypothetical protein